MKSLAFILASALSSVGFATPASPGLLEIPLVQTASNHFLLGREVVQVVRSDYTEGKYTEFLKEMDRDYQEAKESSDLEGLIELRKETAKIQIHPNFLKGYRLIQESKNKELLKAASSAEKTEFTQKVESAAGSIAEIDDHLLALSYKVPGTGANADENKVIEIGLEYYYKAIHLDSIASKTDMADRKEKHMALEMEKMARLLEASQSFTDEKLKQSIEDASDVLDARIAKSYDMSDLLALSKGRIKPLSSLEEKAATIIANSQQDLGDLHRTLLVTLDAEEQN